MRVDLTDKYGPKVDVAVLESRTIFRALGIGARLWSSPASTRANATQLRCRLSASELSG